MKLAPTLKLNNGREMPIIGMETFASQSNEGEIAIKHAIDIGYRCFETSCSVQNEVDMGQSIRDKIAEGVVKREDIFLITKLWGSNHKPELVEGACRNQLANLGLDYFDLYLMHMSVTYRYVDEKEEMLPVKDGDGVLPAYVDYLET